MYIKTIFRFVISGSLFLLFLLTTWGCLRHSDGDETIINKVEEMIESDADNTGERTEQVTIFAGPGQDYLKLTNLDDNEIEKYIHEENGWIEIEYNNMRGYIDKNELVNLLVLPDDLPILVHTLPGRYHCGLQ